MNDDTPDYDLIWKNMPASDADDPDWRSKIIYGKGPTVTREDLVKAFGGTPEQLKKFIEILEKMLDGTRNRENRNN